MAASQTTKANAARKAALKGVHGNKVKKVRTSATFRTPKTLQLARDPKYARKSVDHYPRSDAYSVIVRNVNSEVATAKIESQNTLVLQVNIKSNKSQIKNAVKKLFGAEALKVNTLIRPDGTKKAYVRLTADHDALDVASRAGYL